MTTTSIFALMEILFCLFSGLIIGFIYEWKIALIQLGLLPFQMATAGFTSQYRNG